MSQRTAADRLTFRASIAFLMLVLLGQPWILGGQLLESQFISFLVVFVTSGYACLSNPRNTRIPLILMGLLSCYLLIQYLNPSYVQQWETGLRIWSLVPMDHISWLPSSIRSDISDSSPLRTLMILLTASGLGLYVYRVKERVLRKFILPFISLNALAISIVAFIQYHLDGRSILGFFSAIDEAFPLFYGTFLYKNHAAAFFNLGVAASLASFLLPYRPSNGLRSSPRSLFIVAASLTTAAVIFSKSRFGFACNLGVLTFFAPLIFRKLRATGITMKWILSGGTGIAVLLGITAFFILKSEDVRYLKTLNADFSDDSSWIQRKLTYESSIFMASRQPIYGWGAGNFRHGYRQFQNLSEEEAIKWGGLKIRQQNFFWQHAHNDYLEFLIELGIVGTLILFSIPGYFFWIIFRSSRWKDPVTLMLLAGLGSTLVHALIDFPFRNPAVLTTWFAILAIAAQRCSKSTHSHRSQAPNGSLSGDQGCGRESLHPEPAAPPRPPL